MHKILYIIFISLIVTNCNLRTVDTFHGVSYLEEQCSKEYDDWKTLPNVSRENWDNDYYKNVTEKMIRDAVDVDKIFSSYEFEIEEDHCDLYFWGIKK